MSVRIAPENYFVAVALRRHVHDGIPIDQAMQQEYEAARSRGETDDWDNWRMREYLSSGEAKP